MCGIIVTKADIFPLVATKAASQVIINVAYPCLLFSKIVPAYLTGDNIRALGKY
jgi:predicted permease